MLVSWHTTLSQETIFDYLRLRAACLSETYQKERTAKLAALVQVDSVLLLSDISCKCASGLRLRLLNCCMLSLHSSIQLKLDEYIIGRTATYSLTLQVFTAWCDNDNTDNIMHGYTMAK